MTSVKDYNFGVLRLKRDTIDFLKDMKEAFEVSYDRKFTMDEFIRQMAASVEAGDPGVWDIHCVLQSQRDELKAKAIASQKMREKTAKGRK